MNQPVAHKAPSSLHVVPTLLVGIVCVVSLGAAGVGLYSSHSAKLDLCSLAIHQLRGIHSTVKNDRRLIPHDIKNGMIKTMQGGADLLVQHCPPDSIKPPEPQKPGDPREMVKQLLGSMVE